MEQDEREIWSKMREIWRTSVSLDPRVPKCLGQLSPNMESPMMAKMNMLMRSRATMLAMSVRGGRVERVTVLAMSVKQRGERGKRKLARGEFSTYSQS